MKKYSIIALIIAMSLMVTACSTSSGLLLKEATLKQLELESFESKSTLSIQLDTALLNNSFELDVYTKQVDLLNSIIDFHINPDLLTLASLNNNEDEKVILSLINKNGDTILSTSQDHIGIQLSDTASMVEDEFEGQEVDYEELFLTLQDTFRELMKQYVESYSFSLNQIENHGKVSIELPNGDSVETELIRIEMSLLDAIDMLQYSLHYFLDDEEFQETFYGALKELPLIMGNVANMDEEIDIVHLESEFDSMQIEINTAVKDFLSQLEIVKSEYLLEHENILNEIVKISFDTYIGVEDNETYQTEFTLQFTYTDALNDLNIEGTQSLPLIPGNSITISSKDQYWNHNEILDPIELPGQLVTIQELMEMDSIEDFKEIAGDQSLLSQIADQFMLLFDAGQYNFVELKINENQAETMAGIKETNLYMKNGQLMAPLRFLGESMGAEVTWNNDSHQINVIDNDLILEVSVSDNNTVTLNGHLLSDITVEVINGISYVNVRPFAEAMGWNVLWNPETFSAIVFR